MLVPAPPRPYSTGDDELDRLLQPSRFYRYPKDVLADASLSVSEKRAILSAWVSDACAVDSLPTLRIAPWSHVAVTFDEVMEALQTLDRNQQRAVGKSPLLYPDKDVSTG
jgi:hypothetical protein